MENKLSFSVTMHEEKLSDGKKVFVVECVELGVSDYGDSIKEAMENLKKGITLLLEAAPEKRELLKNEEPLMVTRLYL